MVIIIVMSMIMCAVGIEYMVVAHSSDTDTLIQLSTVMIDWDHSFPITFMHIQCFIYFMRITLWRLIVFEDC